MKNWLLMGKLTSDSGQIIPYQMMEVGFHGLTILSRRALARGAVSYCHTKVGRLAWTVMERRPISGGGGYFSFLFCDTPISQLTDDRFTFMEDLSVHCIGQLRWQRFTPMDLTRVKVSSYAGSNQTYLDCLSLSRSGFLGKGIGNELAQHLGKQLDMEIQEKNHLDVFRCPIKGHIVRIVARKNGDCDVVVRFQLTRDEQDQWDRYIMKFEERYIFSIVNKAA